MRGVHGRLWDDGQDLTNRHDPGEGCDRRRNVLALRRSDIERTAAAIAARGCFRAEWSDEANRERILNPPVREKRRTRQEKRTRTLYIDLSEDRGMSM